MTSWQVYWWLKLDGFKDFFATVAFFSFFTAIITFIIYKGMSCSEYEDTREQACKLKSYKIFAIILIISTILYYILPSTKQMATIYILPKIANSEIAKELPDDLKDMYDMAKEYLKDKFSDK